MQRTTVVAKKSGDDMYHPACAPARVKGIVTPESVDDYYDPEVDSRFCLECGGPILRGKARADFWDIMYELQENSYAS